VLRTNVEEQLRDRQQTATGLIPAYDDYCFSNIPGTAANIFDISVGPSLPNDVFGDIEPEATHVVVLLLDGLGWKRWQRDAESPFISTVSEQGVVTPLTSIAPSCTASAVTTVHTACPVGGHGVLGRSTHIPSHDSIVHSFSFTKRRAESSQSNDPLFSADNLVVTDSIYPQLERAGVKTQVIQPASTLGTNYANVTFQGATQRPVEGPKEAAATLRRTLESATGPTYTYAYFPDIDTVTHENGQDSEVYHQTLAKITRPLERELCEKLEAETASDTLVFVTADHGMIDLQPGMDGCLDLRKMEDVYQNIRQLDGVPGVFGAQQMTHLLVKPGTRDKVTTALKRENVEVFTREEVEEYTLFGSGSAIDRRCGDLVITHRDRKIVHEAAESVIPTIGQHGGLTPGEMLIPLGVIRGSSLQN